MSCELPDYGTDRIETITASKDYACCECHKEISKGKQYRRFTACWSSMDGWKSFKMCIRCVSIRDLAIDKYPQYEPTDLPVFGGLYEYIREERRV